MKLDNPKPGQKAQLMALWQEAFADPEEYIEGFFETAYSPRRAMCIWQEQQVLAAAYWLDCSYAQGRLAYIYAVATARAHRGKGLCHMLMAAIHERLRQEGYVGAILVPGEPSLGKFYSDMGYGFFGGKQEFSAVAASAPVDLQPLTAAEYVRLRMEYLPQGAVEQRNLPFMQRQLSFAAGRDVLLAYSQEKDMLWGAEYLGNLAAAPGVAAALGAKEGRFRTAGQSPFAMFLPLAQVQKPTYFGFAFD